MEFQKTIKLGKEIISEGDNVEIMTQISSPKKFIAKILDINYDKKYIEVNISKRLESIIDTIEFKRVESIKVTELETLFTDEDYYKLKKEKESCEYQLEEKTNKVDILIEKNIKMSNNCYKYEQELKDLKREVKLSTETRDIELNKVKNENELLNKKISGYLDQIKELEHKISFMKKESN